MSPTVIYSLLAGVTDYRAWYTDTDRSLVDFVPTPPPSTFERVGMFESSMHGRSMWSQLQNADKKKQWQYRVLGFITCLSAAILRNLIKSHMLCHMPAMLNRKIRHNLCDRYVRVSEIACGVRPSACRRAYRNLGSEKVP